MRSWISFFYLRCASRLAFVTRFPLLREISSWLLPRGSLTWVRIRGGEAQGFWVAVYPRTGRPFQEGQSERAVQMYLRARLRPRMVFYDLGANFGFFSLIAARLVGPEGRVFAFEPEASLMERIKANVERNGLKNVTLVDAAIWSESGSVTFHRSDCGTSPDRGTGHVAQKAGSEVGIQVRSVALDDFIRQNPAPDVIKCDVEGAELEAFRGAGRLLEQHKPLVICEVHSPESKAGLCTLFAGFGYAVRKIDDSHFAAETSA
jgi:FkbM family methyltransferase